MYVHFSRTVLSCTVVRNKLVAKLSRHEIVFVGKNMVAPTIVASGNGFFGELFVKYSDGFVTTAIPRPPPAPGLTKYTPGGTATVQVQEPGYDEAWYERIVADAGEKYHVPSQSEVIDPRLSTDRLQFF